MGGDREAVGNGGKKGKWIGERDGCPAGNAAGEGGRVVALTDGGH